VRLLELSRTHFDILALDWWFVQAGRRQAVAMPPGKTGVSVRKTARYAGNKRGRLQSTKNHSSVGAFKVRGGLVYMDSLRRREPT